MVGECSCTYNYTFDQTDPQGEGGARSFSKGKGGCYKRHILEATECTKKIFATGVVKMSSIQVPIIFTNVRNRTPIPLFSSAKQSVFITSCEPIDCMTTIKLYALLDQQTRVTQVLLPRPQSNRAS